MTSRGEPPALEHTWAVRLWDGKTSGGLPIGDAEGVLELLWLLLTAILTWMRPRQGLVLENLLLRHQLAVLTRPTRTRPRARLRTWDNLLFRGVEPDQRSNGMRPCRYSLIRLWM